MTCQKTSVRVNADNFRYEDCTLVVRLKPVPRIRNFLQSFQRQKISKNRSLRITDGAKVPTWAPYVIAVLFQALVLQKTPQRRVRDFGTVIYSDKNVNWTQSFIISISFIPHNPYKLYQFNTIQWTLYDRVQAKLVKNLPTTLGSSEIYGSYIVNVRETSRRIKVRFTPYFRR